MLRAAVIGVGYLGKFHAEKIAKNPRAELIALVDPHSDEAKKAAKKYSCAVLSDYRDLAKHNIDCVSIASDTGTHFEVAAWCIEQGFGALLEKPMTASLEEARKLLALRDEHKVVLQVGHLERFNPAFRAVESILTKPRFFEVRRIAKFAGRGHDVDVILDLMIHDIDIVCHLLDEPVDRLEALGVPVLTGSVDIANARLGFAGGAIANVTASRAAVHSERTIRIFQPDLYVSLDFEKKKLKIYEKSSDKKVFGFPDIAVTERRVEERDALADEIGSFLKCVEKKSTPLVTGEDGLRAMELAERIRKAVAEGQERMLPTASVG